MQVRQGFVVLFAVFLLSFVAGAARADVVVDPSNPNGWTFYATDISGALGTGTGTGDFTNGPGTPPLGTGSAHLMTPPGDPTGQSVQLRNVGWAGTRLDALTSLSYSTYGTTWNGPGGQMTYLTLYLDLDGDLSNYEDRIHFEPIYSAAGAGNNNPFPTQGPPVLNTWQSWNALQGMWYSDNGFPDGSHGDPNGPGDDAITLAQYLAAPGNENARIADASPGTVGGIRITAGFAPGSDFEMNVDAFAIGTAAGTTVYNFELNAIPEAGAFWLGALVCSITGLAYGGRLLLGRKPSTSEAA